MSKTRKVKVRFSVSMIQTIDWPEDEMEDFNYDNLHANLDHEKGSANYDYEVLDVKVDGENYDF